MSLTDTQFIQLLGNFAGLDLFSSHDTPVIFVVYAHSSTHGEARADVVRLFINGLKAIRARAVSDKRPLLVWSESSDHTPAGNILDNQLRLLPNYGSHEVGNVILCGSEVLQRYRGDSLTNDYVKKIQDLHRERLDREQFQRRMQSLLRDYSQKPEFHHVLTELAFLQIRKDKDPSNHGIIPVALSGDDVRRYLSFLEESDVFIHDDEPRKLFFKLLKRIFARRQDAIDEIETCYTTLADEKEVSNDDINISTSNTIRKIIKNESAQFRDQDRLRASKTTPHFMVPFGRNREFVGRGSILEQLLETIPPGADQDDCQRTAVEGLGGIGKTQVALEAVYQVRDAHPDCSVFWVPAVDATSFENAYREIGQKLKVKSIEDDKADVKLLVKNALSQESAGSWLLIVDNADDSELLFTATNLSDYLPFSRKGSILFTTRNHEVTIDFDIPQNNILTIPEMSMTEAIQLLQTGLYENQTRDADSITHLLGLLAYLPLAIKQASAYIAKTNTTIKRYLSHYQSSDKTTVKLLSKNFQDRARYKDIQNPVATTWLISFNHIARDYALAAQYLRYICFLAEKDIPRSLLPGGRDNLDADEAIGILKGYAFLTEHKDEESFDIHRLVRLAMRNWIQDKGERKEWVTYGVQQLSLCFPFPEHENRSVWFRYLPHARTALECQEDCDNSKAKQKLMYNVSTSYYRLGKYDEAEAMYRQTLQLYEGVLGREHPSTLSSINNLALVLGSQGKYGEAETMHRQTLQLKEGVLGREHPDTLSSMNNLALVLGSQGKYGEAEAMHRQTLQLREEVLGREHPDTLSSMNNLANVLGSQGKYGEAETMHRQTLQLREEVLGREHPDTLSSMNNLAEVLRSQGKYGEAEAMHRQTLQLKEEVLGREHPDTLSSMNNLAEVLQSQGKYGEAEAMHRQTLQLREEVLGREHPDTLSSMDNLAGVLRSQGKYGEAEAILTSHHIITSD
ncbi:hypothetical protein F5B18DRAFT_587349 [Nemania serpens]|nr:hypothetical protein F5B18DRAFT_587349 [Nemania serpens]